LNQIFSSFNPELSVVTILFVSFIQCINYDWGPPKIPYRGKVYPQNKSSFPENYEGIKYKCEVRNTIIYNTGRTCSEGKWTGRALNCGNYSILFTLQTVRSREPKFMK
jgi:hypothetical protein